MSGNLDWSIVWYSKKIIEWNIETFFIRGRKIEKLTLLRFVSFKRMHSPHKVISLNQPPRLGQTATHSKYHNPTQWQISVQWLNNDSIDCEPVVFSVNIASCFALHQSRSRFAIGEHQTNQQRIAHCSHSLSYIWCTLLCKYGACLVSNGILIAFNLCNFVKWSKWRLLWCGLIKPYSKTWPPRVGKENFMDTALTYFDQRQNIHALRHDSTSFGITNT